MGAGVANLGRRLAHSSGRRVETATRNRRDRVYEQRWNRSRAVCKDWEEEITLHTVNMYDLVPPAPIGMNADILVDRVHKYYWCKVPKAASTSWTSLLLSDRQFADVKHKIGQQHTYLRKLMPPLKNVQELQEVQQNHFSFMTVRHPFERLLSAYRDKFFRLSESTAEANKAEKFHRLYGRKILAKYRQPNDTLVLSDSRYAKAPTFPEFVDFLLNTEVEEYNEHWVPFYLLCTPCHLNYTIVAKTETIQEDSRYILEVLRGRGIGKSKAQTATLARIHQTGGQPSQSTAREFFSQLNKEAVKSLYDKYEVDMEMWDYRIEPYLSYAVNTLPPKYAPKQEEDKAE